MHKLPETLGIRHIALRVRDLQKSEDFYVKTLGYRVEWRPDAENVYLCRDRDNLALHRVENINGPGALDHFGIVLKTPKDVDVWAAYLKARSIEVLKEPKTHRDGARSFYVNDPEGNTIQFIYHPPISGGGFPEAG
ncbi:MAG: glyoxalase [Elusimicrobia bacterium RIFCSPLOWO2_12_FULL_59_9]|nr:MAG: glyoxalase [Elusimicrobia bacterium RIFCSPLOWO2_12_FULL_59_9]